jgi:hypothetical protein
MAELQTKGQAAQDFVPIKEIRDGVVILKTGQLRMAVIVSSVNLALKSEEEQNAILLQFQNFLNGLDFHVQLFVQSRQLDIRPYLRTLEERLNAQTNELLQIQTREYIEFIKKFSSTTDIMTKSFFVIVPFDPAPNLKRRRGTATEDAASEFANYRAQLEQRVAVVAQGFTRFGLRVVSLGTEELVELYFKIFNPGETDMPAVV